MSDILIERDGAVAIVTLNRPEAMNALSRALRAAFAGALAELGRDPDVRAIVLTGAGRRAFCAGLDLKELGQDAGAVFEAVGPDVTANPVAAMAACGKPIVGAINGSAVTGGFELALACDILVGSHAARFADTHVKVEVMPGWGLSQRLSRIVGAGRAKEMSLTGRFVDAATAQAWGILNHVVAPEALLAKAVAIARAIADQPPAMVARYRALIDDGLALPFAEALALEQARALDFNAGVSADAIEGRRETVRESNRRD